MEDFKMADEDNLRSCSPKFPSFSFPYYQNEQIGQYFIDYGSTNRLNIDLDSNATLLSIAKQQRTRSKKYIALSPTLPLLPPCETLLTSKDLPDVQKRFSLRKTNYKPTLGSQVCNFTQDHPDIQFSSIVELVQDEFDSEELCSCFALTKKSLLPYARNEDPVKNHCPTCNLLIPWHDGWGYNKTYRSYGKTRPHMNGHLSEALSAIPSQLLFECLEESVIEQTHEKLYFDLLQGNLLAYCSLSDCNITRSGVLLYPSGPCLEKINMSFVDLQDLEDNMASYGTEPNLSFKPRLLSSGKQLEIQDPLRQIDAVFIGGQEISVTTRSRYNCSLFRSSGMEEREDGMFSLEPLESLACQVTPMCISTSPYIPGEAVIVMETGEAYLWKCGKQLDSIHIMPVSPEVNQPWYHCVYGPHPRSVLFANSIVADLVDFRVKSPSQSRLFSITSSHLNIKERFSAIQRHPGNPHHCLLATDQSLLLVDDRFVQHSVLSWRHHLQDPIQFLEAMVDNQETSVLISGSIHRETHCFMYNGSGSDLEISVPLGGATTVQPPVSTGLPWRLSPYDEWPSLLPMSSLPLSTVITDRLSSPLIGMCQLLCVNGKGHVAVQLSASGDMFYQPFVADHVADRDTAEKELSDDAETSCKQWIDAVLRMDKAEKRTQPWPLESNRVVSNCHAVFKTMTDISEPHNLCALCRQNPDTADTALDDDDDDDVVCPRCGFGLPLAARLRSSYQDNKIITRNTLEMDQIMNYRTQRRLFNNPEGYRDPLSKSLLMNWLEDTPTPTDFEEPQKTAIGLDTTEQTNAGDREVIQVDKDSEVLAAPVACTDERQQADTHVIHEGSNSPLENPPPDLLCHRSQLYAPDSPIKLERLGQHSPIRTVSTPPCSPKRARTTAKKPRRKLGNTMGF